MGFTYEERVIIKYLHQKYHYGATKIKKDHPEFEEWTLGGIKWLVDKIDETGEIERREGSGRPRTVRVPESIVKVEELVLSQEDKPGTHMTPNEIALHMDISRRSVMRIVHDDLNLSAFKKIKAHKLSEGDCEKRLVVQNC